MFLPHGGSGAGIVLYGPDGIDVSLSLKSSVVPTMKLGMKL